MNPDNAINIDSILKQFGIVEESLKRAKLPFETNMLHDKVIEVSLWELIKSYHQIENMVREIAPDRFGETMIVKRTLHTPEITEDKLWTCPYCGNPDCQSDHK